MADSDCGNWLEEGMIVHTGKCLDGEGFPSSSWWFGDAVVSIWNRKFMMQDIGTRVVAWLREQRADGSRPAMNTQYGA